MHNDAMAHTSERLSTSPTATSFEVAEILEMAQTGKLRVPHFQRPFRWVPGDVHKLLDSIIRGYPIGSLLLWKRPAVSEKIRFGRLRFDADAREDALWIVDGQQRVVSLLEALFTPGSEPSIRLAYDLAEGKLVFGVGNQAPDTIPLSELFDLSSLMLWMSENPGAQQYVHTASEVAKSIRQYKVPAYVVESDDVGVLQDVFDRINNAGKPLKRSDVFQALNSTFGGSSSRHGHLRDLAARVHTETGFGLLTEDIVLTALLATRGTDPFMDERQDFGGPESDRDAIRLTESTIRQSVDFLLSYCRVPHLSLLPHRFVFYVLVRLFAVSSDTVDQRERVLLRRWVWRSIAGGVSGSPGGTIGLTQTLLRCVEEGQSVGINIKNLLAEHDSRTPFALNESFDPTTANSKVIMCALVDALERHEVGAARSLALDVGVDSTAKVGIVFVSSLGSTSSTQSRSPGNVVFWQREGSFENYVPAVEGCTSLVIDEIVAKEWRRGNFDGAIKHRTDLVEGLTQDFVESLCEWDLPDTPSLSKIQDGIEDDWASV